MGEEVKALGRVGAGELAREAMAEGGGYPLVMYISIKTYLNTSIPVEIR